MSEREITTALANAFAETVVRPLFLFEAEFSTPVRFFNGAGSITVLSKTWTGSGSFLMISDIVETASLTAEGMQFTLTGLSSSLLSIALTEDYQHRPARIYVGATDVDGAVIADPFLAFEGFMDQMMISDDGATATITLTVEGRLISLTRANLANWTPEQQKLTYATDTGFDGVAALQDQEIIWKG